MSQTHRKDGGLIDQDKTITFTFNGQILRGCEGDTWHLRYLPTTNTWSVGPLSITVHAES